MKSSQRKSHSAMEQFNHGDLSGSCEPICHSLPYSNGAVLSPRLSTSPTDSQIDLLSVLRDLIHVAATSSTADQLVKCLTGLIEHAFDTDGCVVVLFKPPVEQITLSCWLSQQEIAPTAYLSEIRQYLLIRQSLDVEALITPVTTVSTQLTGTVFSASESIWQHLQLPISLLSSTSVLEVVTQFQGVANGVISLLRSPARSWTTAEMETLELISQQVAILVAHQQLQQQMNQQLQSQAIMNHLTLAIRDGVELHDVFKLTTDDVVQVFGGTRALLLRVRYANPLFHRSNFEEMPNARVTIVAASSNSIQRSPQFETISTSTDSLVDQSFSLTECDLCQQMVKELKSIAIDDTHQYLSEIGSATLNSFLDLEHFNASLMTPISHQGTVFGFLVVQDCQTRSWQQADLELIELISVQVSNVIIQTETLRQVQSLVEKRTTELQHSLTIQAKLYERTRQQVEQLRQLNQLKDEFLDTVSHELRTPLTSMALAIRMLRQADLTSDRANRYLDILEQQCAQETNLINDLLALRELESKQIAIYLTDINLTEFVNKIAQGFAQRWAGEDLRLNLDFPDFPIIIRSDRDSLARILIELLTNAGKYSSPKTCIQLQLIYHEEEPINQITISVTNTGFGILPEELPFIFDKFRRCRGITQNAIPGTGLGLALVKSLVQHLNGTISASSQPIANSQDWETCFNLILPRMVDH